MEFTMTQRRTYSLCVRALRNLGAKSVKVMRTPTDANGVETGEPEQITTLYGIIYRSRQSNTALEIGLPGIVIRGDNNPRFIGVPLLDALDKHPLQGDDIQTGEGMRTIVDAALHAGILYEIRFAKEGVG